jgi:hypothetical protein
MYKKKHDAEKHAKIAWSNSAMQLQVNLNIKQDPCDQAEKD